MKVEGLRSSYREVGGLVFFGRLLDKIRLKAQGRLPEGWATGPDVGSDRRCARFLRVTYEELATRVAQGGTDDEVLAWCFERGRKPDDEEIQIWNAFMTKRGWRDDATEALEAAKREAGFGHRTDILTYFDFQDADEGREAQPLSEDESSLFLGYIDACNAKDVERMIVFFSEDCLFENISAGKVTAHTKGKAELESLARKSAAAFESREQKVLSMIRGPGRIVAEIEYRGILRSTPSSELKAGAHLEFRGISVVEFFGGKIVRLTDYS